MRISPIKPSVALLLAGLAVAGCNPDCNLCGGTECKPPEPVSPQKAPPTIDLCAEAGSGGGGATKGCGARYWVGALPKSVNDPADFCAKIANAAGWKSQPLVRSLGSELPWHPSQAFCRFTHAKPSDNDVDKIKAEAANGGLTGFGPDCPIVHMSGEFASGSRFGDRRLMSAMRLLGLARAGALADRAAAVPTKAVRVAILDDVPDKYESSWAAVYAGYSGVKDKYKDVEPSHAHGLTVASIVRDVACSVISCPAGGEWLTTSYRQALTWMTPTMAQGEITVLADELLKAPGSTSEQLVINLSLGWDPADKSVVAITKLFELDNGSWKWKSLGLDAATDAALRALVIASCRGAIVVAAAGNTKSSCPEVGEKLVLPVLPAAWSDIPRPSKEQCGALGLIGGDTSTGGQLLYAVGALDSEGLFLANAREKGRPGLAAMGEGVVAHNEETGFEVLHGSSAATAVVSGAAALVWSQRGDMSANEVMKHLQLETYKMEGLTAWEDSAPGPVYKVHPCKAAESACIPAGGSDTACEFGCVDANSELALLSDWVQHRLEEGRPGGVEGEGEVKPQPNDYGCHKCGLTSKGRLVLEIDPFVRQLVVKQVKVAFEPPEAHSGVFDSIGTSLPGGAGEVVSLPGWPATGRPVRASLQAEVHLRDSTVVMTEFDLWIEGPAKDASDV